MKNIEFFLGQRLALCGEIRFGPLFADRLKSFF
jgi:hypothetical protein